MKCWQAVGHRFDWRGQVVVGGIHVAEHRVASARRSDVDLKHHPEWWCFVTRNVGVPKFAVRNLGIFGAWISKISG